MNYFSDFQAEYERAKVEGDKPLQTAIMNLWCAAILARGNRQRIWEARVEEHVAILEAIQERARVAQERAHATNERGRDEWARHRGLLEFAKRQAEHERNMNTGTYAK